MLVHRHTSSRRSGSFDRTVVFLHGLGDDLDGWSFLPGALGFDGHGWLFVQAPLPWGSGWSWYDFDNPQTSARQIPAHVAELRHLLDELGLNPATTLLAGFSQGAAMVLETSLRADVTYAGVLAISGYMPLIHEHPAAFGPEARTQRVLATHGNHDQVLPLEVTRTHVQRLRGLGINIELELFDKGHDFDPFAELPRVRRFLGE